MSSHNRLDLQQALGMLATLPVLALIERRSLGCDLTTRGSTQVVAWRVLGIVIDQRLLDP